MKSRPLPLLLLLLFVLMLAAVGTSYIPWGDPRLYHGIGVPFPTEYWDGGVHNRTWYGLPFNILLFWIVGFIGLLAVRMIGAASKRR